MKTFKKILFSLLTGIPLWVPLRAAVYNPHSHTLKNGLEVIVVKNHRAPLVVHMMVVKVGTNDSPWGKSGLAHYLEHLMFKGEPSSAAGKIMQEVTRLGGTLNAQTTPEYTLYYEVVPKEHIETVMAMDAERLEKLDIQEKWARPEVDVILEERHMRYETTVMGKFSEQMQALSIRHHPSRLPVIGWQHEIKGYTTKDAQDFYHAWYAPNNAFVLIYGDITFEEGKRLAEKFYGSIPRKELPARLEIQEPKGYEASQSFFMTSAIAQSPIYGGRYPAPTFNEGEKQKFYALVVLENLLSRPVTGKLTEALIERRRLAAQFSLSYEGLQAGPGHIQISMTPIPSVSLEQLEGALAEEITLLLKKGVTEQEVENAKAHLLSDLVYTQDDLISGAHNLGSLYASAMPLADIEAWPDSIKKVTAEQVNKTLQDVFAHPKPVIGRLVPAAQQGLASKP